MVIELSLPRIPETFMFSDRNGNPVELYMVPQWQDFFRSLFVRAGAYSEPFNLDDIEALLYSDTKDGDNASNILELTKIFYSLMPIIKNYDVLIDEFKKIISMGLFNPSSSNVDKGYRLTEIDNTDSPYSVLNSDQIIMCDTDAGAIEIDLPPGTDGKRFEWHNCGSSGNDLTVDPNGVETIYGGLAGVAATFADGEGGIATYSSIQGWR